VNGQVVRVILDLPWARELDYLQPVAPAAAGTPSAATTPAAEAGELAVPTAAALEIGALCLVPLGRRKAVGIVVGFADAARVPEGRLKPVIQRLGEMTLGSDWLELCRFAGDYYHRGWGEVAIPALPPALRAAPARRPRKAKVLEAKTRAPAGAPAAPALRNEQAAAIDAIDGAAGRFQPFLLYGVTGSGKTEVYLGAIAGMLARDPQAQALLLVPEINLTPQLHERLAARFPGQVVLSLHSALPPRERARAWARAHAGEARVVLGTRTAVFASLPRLRLLLVDEEHDPSFKAQSGVPYSARDLAVKRAHLEGVPVVLGSATPALETWQRARSGAYQLLALAERGAGGGGETRIRTLDLKSDPAPDGLSATLCTAIDAALAAGEQALVFINRRGFAPVLRCRACDWLSGCPRCDAYAAFHKAGSTLRCHHCGWARAVPRACPDCGNQDLEGVGLGSQRIEEAITRRWPAARVARIDRDSTQGIGGARRAEAAFEAMHAGDIDILVGTQMVAKGHDFRRVSVVGILNADGQLVSTDYRAPERLFALLMQVAGRAGRDGRPAQVLVQTRYPAHPLFAALAAQDYAAFAGGQIGERQAAAMPPFAFHALLTATARELEPALAFLQEAVRAAEKLPKAGQVVLFDPVPMPLARLAAQSRAQLLVESSDRPGLHRFLDAWLEALHALPGPSALRWSIEVDPLEI
jgi:primosomal protein N' (replication factor Y)